MQDLVRQDSQEAAGQPEASEPVPDTGQGTPARPGPSEGLGNGAAVEVLPPAPRPPGRPKGSSNKDKLAIRRWMGPKAKKLTLNQVQSANKIFDAALAGEKVTDARLDFAGSVAKQAREYSYGKPTESREISGPDGGPIETLDLIPAESHQRLAAVFRLWQTQKVITGSVDD